jgi:hypothetical protein
VRALWTLARIVIALLAIGTALVTVFFVTGPSGTTVDSNGAVIDAVALVVLIAVAWSLWRDRRSLF